jgi:predicted RNase H-related nuclease YkuK (DUF458 family)
MKKIDLEEVKDFILSTSSSTKIYIGSDSARFRKHDVWFAEYATVVVVHYDGNRGCRIFGQLESERDFDQKKDKPRMRLMNEVIKTAQMYMELADAIQNRHVEIHLDINPNEKHGSSCVISEAVGYIKGMCNVIPFVKPRAFAASVAADRLLA